MTTASGSGEERTGDVSELLALVARQLDLRMPEIVREMRDLLASRIDDLGGDPQLVDMLQASIEGNVTTICHILANGIDLESLQPTTAAVEYAARLAQRDVPLAALTRAYYLGQSMFLRLAMDEAERLGVTDRVKIGVVRDIADVVHRYIDWILQLVTGVHEQERRRWWSTRATLNASIILKVLRGDSLPIRGFVSETGYTLAQTHLGVMAWSDVDAEDAARQHEIDLLLRRLATAVHSSAAPLITVVDRSTAWAWFGGARLDAGALARVEELVATVPGVRIALGEPGHDVEGFRRTHEQAAISRLVALSSPRYRYRAVVSYADPQVALVQLLTKDATATVTWVREVLGDYAGAGEQARVMRDTVATYYAADKNAVRTAEQLGVHRNTVRQRVDRFEASVGARGVDPLQVALALRIYDDLSLDGGDPRPT
ncbi:PucR C-terminal helix-turn-helix domain-containing protein [Microbacterium hydrothermale]|uniref:PucR family transcriptional regulator n=1 Tax=Microbacterium hydrothermale TaxID=857427 RepID=UPI002226EB93|nr:helix-turn-helix domain-containing protein [Microbacterium hydrothermale]MCW2163672.1 PucR C-terminal helix-turn-helix domain-containing protein [Microbacterium hydrothermale]